MPAPPRILAINLGSQTVGVAEFRTQPHGGLVLVCYRWRTAKRQATPAAGGNRSGQ